MVFQPRQRIVKSIATYEGGIFIGTGNGVFISKDQGGSWEDFGSSQLEKDADGNSLINWIDIDEQTKRIFIATSFGAYVSDVEKANWGKIFEGTKIESAEVNSLTINKGTVYLATDDGLQICKFNHERFSCKKITTGIEADPLSGNYEIEYVLEIGDKLLVSASNGVYLLSNDLLSSWKVSDNIQTLDNGKVNAKQLYIDVNKNLWLACGSGVYLCKGCLESKEFKWERVSEGIKHNTNGFKETFYFYELDDVLYLASSNGAYFFNKQNSLWEEISSGIRTKEGNKNVYFLKSLNDYLYAATDEGLFAIKLTASNEQRLTSNEFVLRGKVEADFTNLEEIEPSVIEVQKQALRFSSLPTSSDFKRYRTQARVRNLLPNISFDINSTGANTNFYGFENGLLADKTLNNKFNTSKTQHFQTDGRSFKQLSVLWKTNEFLYDDEIREILNQARLTANIKENILDEITRIYYQRRKLQLDLLLEPPIQISEKLTKQLSLDELTGQLDSRTGGWFSRELKNRKSKMGRITNGKV